MEKVCYRRVIIPAKDSPDGEYPAVIQVTEEVNGILVSADSHDGGFEFLKWYVYHAEVYQAIEFAVTIDPMALNDAEELSDKFFHTHKPKA